MDGSSDRDSDGFVVVGPVGEDVNRCHVTDAALRAGVKTKSDGVYVGSHLVNGHLRIKVNVNHTTVYGNT